jgi:hypothetical protein
MTTIKTKLLKIDEIDYLEFSFINGETKRVNINDPGDSSTLKSVFNQIIEIAMNSDISLEDLEIDSSIGGGLLADVFTEYVTDLNQEIGRIRAELRTEDEIDEG